MAGERILIVEDEYAIASGIQEMLEIAGYQVVGVAESGEQALAKTLEKDPEVILMDIRLRGDMDGVQAAETIRSRLDIPIIYVTGNTDESLLQRSRQTGPLGYLFKPFDVKQLTNTVAMTLYRQKMDRKVKEGERWLNAVLNNIGEGIVAIDRQALITFMNPIAERMTGLRQCDSIGKPIAETLHLLDETTNEPFELLFSDALGQNLSFSRRNQLMLLPEGGPSIPVEITLASISDQPHKVEGMVIALRDVTERKRADQEIRRQASLSESLARVASRLNSRLDVNYVLNMVARETALTLDVETAGVILLDEEKDAYKLAATYSRFPELAAFRMLFQPIPVEVYHGILDRLGPVFNTSDIQSIPLPVNKQLFDQADIRSIAVAVMEQDQTIIGTLNAVTIGKIRQFSAEELAFLKGLADQAAIAILNARLFEQVLSGRERLRFMSRKLVEVQEAERRFLGRELHDQIGQVLTGLQFTLEEAKTLKDEKLTATMTEAQGIVSGLMGQLREISLDLRPPMLDDLGLLPTLLWHFDKYSSRTGVQVEFEQAGLERRFPAEIETAAYRIIQEALTNVARYAEVREVKVRCQASDTLFKISIQDQGRGFDPEQVFTEYRTFGLAGMRERANLLGGKFTVKSAPNAGSSILAELPLERPLERRKHDRNRAFSR